MRVVRFTIQRLMIAIVLVSVGLAAFRLHFSLGCFVSTVLCLAFFRTLGVIDRSEAIGAVMVLRAFLISIFIAFIIHAAALVPAFLLFPFGPDLCGLFSNPLVLITGSVLYGILIVTVLRRRIW